MTSAIFCAFALGSGSTSAHEGLHHDIERETKVLAEHPNDPDALVRRAHYYRLDGQLTKSLSDLDRARDLDPDAPGIALERGLTLSALGRDAEAELEFDRVVAGSMRSPTAYRERGLIRARSGRTDLAIEDLDAAITLAPSIDLYLERGRLLEEEDRLAEAAAGYRDGLEHIGDTVLLERALIRVEIARRQYQEALGMIDAQLAKGSLMTEWHLRRAEVLEALGRKDEARESRLRALDDANRLIRKRPTSSNLVSRAEAHLALGDREAARRDLETALRHSPQSDRARELLKGLADEKAAD